MRILVIGGTRFVGSSFVAEALARGHEVTLFHRGSGAEPFPEAEHRHGDRDADLAPLAAGSWDATVDVCAYRPEQVERLAAALGGRGGSHLFVSTVSVYAPPPGPGFTEDAELIELVGPGEPTPTEVTDQTYGALKVLCERAAATAYGAGLVIVRPTYVVGPDDYSWRFPAWLARIAAGGEVLCPGPPDTPAQVIDARDQARFMVDLMENGTRGTFHTVSPPPPFSLRDLLDAVAAELAPAGTTFTWIDRDRLRAVGLPEPALPLWSSVPAEDDLGAADPSAALAAGLSVRPLAQTIRETWAWMNEPSTEVLGGRGIGGIGLTPAQEADLLRTLG